MFTFLVFLGVLGFVVYRAMTPDDRARALKKAAAFIRDVRIVIDRRRQEPDAFRDAIRARTPWVIATPLIIAVNLMVFVGMLFGSGSFSNPDTLIAWGGSFGPQTTNGAWWRVATSLFVHEGFFHLLINGLMLLQLGLLLERLVGRAAMAAVFVAAGVFSNIGRLSASPVDVHVGESGAIFGLFGLLVASCLWSLLHRSEVTVPLRNLRRLIPITLIFLLYNGIAGGADQTGFVVGFGCGVLLARGISAAKPAPRRVAMAAGAAAVLAVVAAVPLRGVTDVRPEVARVIALEERTAGEYDAARDRFTTGKLSREKLIDMIDKAIVPELEQSAARLGALDGVPDVHRPLIADAEAFLQVRQESWRLRSTGLRKTDMMALRKADARERDAETALEKLQRAGTTH